MIDLITKEGISVWKTATDPNKPLDHITLTAENGDKFLAQIKNKCSEFRISKLIRIPTTGNGVPENLQGGPWKFFGEYRKLLYNYQEISEDQVTALDCYYRGGNDVQCVKLHLLVTVPLDFTMVDLELQCAKEKQQYCICSKMLFQIIKNNVREKYFELYMVELDRFLLTDNLTGDEIGDGVILLKIVLGNIKPSTVIDMQYLEEKLASATLLKYKKRTFLRKGYVEDV